MPEELENRRENGIVNIVNNDQECFKWAVTRYLNPVACKRDDAQKLTKKLRDKAEKLDWTGINFPVSFHDIDIFENLNKISVMVLGWPG